MHFPKRPLGRTPPVSVRPRGGASVASAVRRRRASRSRQSKALVGLALALLFAALGLAPSAHASPGLELGRERASSAVDAALVVVAPPRDPRDAAAVSAAPALPPVDVAALRGRQVIWARLDWGARADAPTRWLLYPDAGWKRVTLYDAAGGTSTTGVDVPLAERGVPLGRPAFVLEVAPGARGAVLLRFEGDLDGWEAPGGFVGRLLPEPEALAREMRGRFLLGVYAGLLFVVAFVNLLFGRVLRDRLFLVYAAYAIPFATIWLAHHHVGAEVFYPAAPWIDEAVLFVSICAALLGGNRFATRFLRLEVEAPSLRLALVGVDAAVAFTAALAFAGAWRAVTTLLGLVAVVASTLYLVGGVLVASRGQREGRYFLAATGMLALGTIVYTLADFDLLPGSALTEYGAQLGSAMEMVLLAYALADRVRRGEEERRAAEARLRDGLERAVDERTEELAHANAQLVSANEKLELLSLTDPLTGVANRRRFEAALEAEWRRAARDGSPIALVLGDVDHFKAFNDRYGHRAGDACLRRVAEALATGARREGELLARYGGEEFALVFPGTTLEAAAAHAEALRRKVAAEEIACDGIEGALHVTISFGVAVASPGEGGAPAELVSEADEALYRAKGAGRDRVERAAGAREGVVVVGVG